MLGDGKAYRLRLRSNPRGDGIVYQSRFQTEGAGWEVRRLPF
ncbi:MAG: CIA30 family protein, partial [Gammaproteobacteria bacterium]